jgi:hypothetical protein
MSLWKNRPKCSPTDALSKLYVKLPKTMSYFCKIKKLPKENNGAKIRPTWSPWLRVYFWHYRAFGNWLMCVDSPNGSDKLKKQRKSSRAVRPEMFMRGLPDFSWHNLCTKTGKNVPNYHNINKWPYNISYYHNKYIPTFSKLRPSKNYPNWAF